MALRPGDRVRLVSPSSPPTETWLAESIEVLRGWGLEPEVGSHALDHWGFMAGRDDDRLADLNDAFRDPGVRAVIATRGGAGAYRIADRIDFAALRCELTPGSRIQRHHQHPPGLVDAHETRHNSRLPRGKRRVVIRQAPADER
jgi:muramoyltetrapeptide carboxypeptidase LdcA involved in peptidoglycan recycling